MPTGPFNFPRFTSLGPLADAGITEDDLIIETTEEKPEMGPGWEELKFLSDQDIIPFDPNRQRAATFTRVITKVMYEDDVPLLFDEVKKRVGKSLRETFEGTYTIGQIKYGYTLFEVGIGAGRAEQMIGRKKIGYSRQVKVNEDMRRLGIATDLKEIAEKKMKSDNVDVIYALTTNEAALNLNKSLNYIIDEELTAKYFNTTFIGVNNPEEKPFTKWVKKEI